jgi:nitroreductase
MKFTRLVPALAVAVAFGAPAYAQKPAATPPAATPPSAQPANGNAGTVNLPTTLPGTPQTSPAIPNPRAFNSVVRDAKALPGFFTLYQKEEKVWIELKPEQLETPYYLSINRTRGLGEGFIYPFMMRGYVVEFRKVGSLVQMIAKNGRYAAKEGTALAHAARESFTDSLLAAAPVASEPHPERKSILVDASGLFINDIPGTATELEAAFRAPYSFDQRNSSFTKVRSTTDMATFAVSAHFAMAKLPPPSPGPAPSRTRLPTTLEDARSMFLDDTGRTEQATYNTALQTGYFILGLRAAGLAAGPMGGFDRDGVDAEFFADTAWKAQLVVNIGHPGPDAWFDRFPRISVDDAVRTV